MFAPSINIDALLFNSVQWKEPVHRAGIFEDDSLLINGGGKTGQKWRQKKAANMTRRPRFSYNKQTNKQRANTEKKRERDEKKETWKDEIQTGDTKGCGGRWHHMGQMSQPPTSSHELLLTGAELQSCPASSQTAPHTLGPYRLGSKVISGGHQVNRQN